MTGWVNIVFEFVMTLVILWGFIHEEDLIEFETIIKQWAKRGFKKGRGSNG